MGLVRDRLPRDDARRAIARLVAAHGDLPAGTVLDKRHSRIVLTFTPA